MKSHAAQGVRDDCLEVLQGRSKALAPLANSTVTIAGGTGFVGSWLAEMLAALNDHHGFKTRIILVARGVDQLRRGRAHLSNRPDVTLLKSDVRTTFELPRQTQWLVHAAATPDNRSHATSPIETMAVMAHGTEALLRAAERCSDLRMFLNVSSAAVYGPQPLDLAGIPESFPGSPDICAVGAAYAEAKRYAETLCAAFRSQLRVPVATVRPFAFIGPYQSLTSPWAINNFIHDALAGRPIRVLGDGRTIRSYMYPSDMAFWLLRILCGASSGARYNVGSPEPIELGKLAHAVASFFEARPDVAFSVGPSRQPVSRLVPDVALARDTFDLSLTVPLTEALSRTIRWNTLLAGEAAGLS